MHFKHVVLPTAIAIGAHVYPGLCCDGAKSANQENAEIEACF